MKKLIALLLVAAFALSPMVQSEAQAAPKANHLHAKHLKKENRHLKRENKRLRHRLHAKGHGHKQAV